MTNFQIYPAIDLKDGNCVRLTHGKEDDMTIYEVDPIKQVNFFSKIGFSWIHMVDLNAAFGKYDNKKIILQILQSWGLQPGRYFCTFFFSIFFVVFSVSL